MSYSLTEDSNLDKNEDEEKDFEIEMDESSCLSFNHVNILFNRTLVS